MMPAPAAALLIAGLWLQQAIPAGHVTVHYWPEQRALAERLAERIAAAPPLPALPPDILAAGPVDVWLAPDAERWDSITGGAIPEWGAGVADPFTGRIVLPTYDWARTPLHATYRTLRHELAHVGLQRHLGHARVPRWFTEGYAQWAAGQWDWDSAWRLRIALAGHRTPPLDSLTLDWPAAAADARVAYLLSASAMAYLVDRSGEHGLRVLLDRWRASGDFDAAFRATFGRTVGQFEDDWRRHVRSAYGWPMLLAHSLVFWFAVVILMGALYAIRRRRDRERMEQLRATEPPDDPAFWNQPPPDEPGGTPEPTEPTGPPGASGPIDGRDRTGDHSAS